MESTVSSRFSSPPLSNGSGAPMRGDVVAPPSSTDRVIAVMDSHYAGSPSKKGGAGLRRKKATSSSSSAAVAANGTTRDGKDTNGDTSHNRQSSRAQHHQKRPTQALLMLLIIFLTLAVIVEMILMDYLLFQENQNGGGGARWKEKGMMPFPMSAADMYISDSGALVEDMAIFKPGTTAQESSSSLAASTGKLHTTTLDSPLRSPEEVLTRAGIEVTPEIKDKLPPKEEVLKMYGDKPILMGTETCATFRETIPSSEALIAPAGMFNTGTNLLSELLQAHCYLPDRVAKHGKHSRGIRLQVPWGKHSPVSFRLQHVSTVGGGGIEQTNVLPIIVIKDPYTWMTSMCRHPYTVKWGRYTAKYCPNLVKTGRFARKEGLKTWDVTIKYDSDTYTHHDSLADLWNDWYVPWMNVTFPRLIVRFEDLLFHAEKLVTEVCHCGGGVMEGDFTYITESAKKGGPHEGSSGLTSSITRYSNSTLRILEYQEPDMKYARERLRSDLVNTFHYEMTDDAFELLKRLQSADSSQN